MHEIGSAFLGEGYRVPEELAVEVAERWVDVEDAFGIYFADKFIVLGAFIGTLAAIEIPRLKDSVIPRRNKKNLEKVVQIHGSATGTERPGFRIP
jgi:hypothetical protein